MRRAGQCPLCLVQPCAQRLPVAPHPLRIVQPIAQVAFAQLESLTQHVARREIFQIAAYGPALVAAHTIFDQIFDPANQFFIRPLIDRIKQEVDRFVHGLSIIEFDPIIGRQTQFVRQVGQELLKELIDRHHLKMVIIVQDPIQCRLRPLFEVGRLAQTLGQRTREIVVSTFGQVVQISEDALLHFRRRLIGKRHGQNVAVRAPLR